MAAAAKTFEAVLKTGGQMLGWTIVRVPFDPHTAWKQMVRQRVCGTISGPGGSAAFRTSLFPDSRAEDGLGRFHVLVNKSMQRTAGVRVGAIAKFTLMPDLEPRPAELPEELDALLDDEPGLRDWYLSLSENTRRQIGTYLQQVKSPESRMKRAEEIAERMMFTMEAEHELPPAIGTALRRRPQAEAGWQKMTPTQRRMEIFAVAAYKTPQSRGKRIDKLCDAAEKKLK